MDQHPLWQARYLPDRRSHRRPLSSAGPSSPALPPAATRLFSQACRSIPGRHKLVSSSHAPDGEYRQPRRVALDNASVLDTHTEEVVQAMDNLMKGHFLMFRDHTHCSLRAPTQQNDHGARPWPHHRACPGSFDRLIALPGAVSTSYFWAAAWTEWRLLSALQFCSVLVRLDRLNINLNLVTRSRWKPHMWLPF